MRGGPKSGKENELIRNGLNRLGLASVAVGTVLVVSSTAAFAYWRATGTGAGSVDTASTLTAPTVSWTFSPTTLVPGAAASTVTIKFTNTNPSTSVFVNVSSVALGTLPTGCVAADITFAQNTLTYNPTSKIIPAGTGSTLTVTGPTIKMNDTGADQTNCLGKAIALSVTF
jgi:hypothetical protein